MLNDSNNFKEKGNTGLIIIILILSTISFVLLIHTYDFLVHLNFDNEPARINDSTTHSSSMRYLYESIFDFADRLASISAKVVTWPFAALAFAVVFLWKDGHKIFFAFLGRTTKLKFAQMEIHLSEESAKLLQMNAEAFIEFKKLADAEFSRQLTQYNVRHCLRITLNSTHITIDGQPKRLMDIEGIRCTIHVRDIMFTDNLLQLIDYYPDGGAGAMRRFSIRYGAIGRTWRMERHLGRGFDGKLPPDELVRKWGMTQDESVKISRGGASYLCVLLTRDDKVPIAVLYLDSKTPNAFGTDQDAQKACDILEFAARDNGLSKALEAVTNELKKYAANIDIQINR